MRKINNVPVEAHTDLSSLTGGEVLKWDADNTMMVWELQDGTSYTPVKRYGDRGIFPVGLRMDYISISTAGDGADFGDITTLRQGPGGLSGD